MSENEVQSLLGKRRESAARTLPCSEPDKSSALPGGFVYLPANMPHSVWTADTEFIVQVTGTGPFGLNYVNPADDPSKGGNPAFLSRGVIFDPRRADRTRPLSARSC